ncbi:MAG: recombination regulator RecX [Gemmatimonadetes bacterium]|nr:recombination regulator RecX [Gemmatimonadota bacterium]
MRRHAPSAPSEIAPDAPAVVRAFTESPRRPGRWVIVLEDGRKWVVGAAVLGEVGIPREGQHFTTEQVIRLTRESEVTAVADRALDALARGRKTRRELERRFQRAGREAEVVRVALDRLATAGLLSDEEVARAEASSRLRRGEAPGRVRQRLRAKGVEPGVVASALQEATAEDRFDELEACRTAARKRVRAMEGLERVVAYRRLMGFLLRRGFGGATAGRVAREVLGDGGDASDAD